MLFALTLIWFTELACPQEFACDSSVTPILEASTMQSRLMRAFAVKKAKTTYPTGNKNFAVLQAFPSVFSEIEADPFLMCDEFGPKLSTGKVSHPDEFPIGWHPHRGMDILTYMKSGIGRHGDSMGNRGEFASPGMQWISVGSGIEHAEGGGTPAGEYDHGFQIWVNVPAEHKMDDPRYGTEPPQNLPLLKGEGYEARLLAGAVGDAKGPFKTVQDVQIIDFEILPNSQHEHFVPINLNNCLIYVYKGEGTICGSQVPSGSVIHLDASDPESRSINFQTTDKGLSGILFAGKKLNEPIAWQGPIVMNTDEQVHQAYAEYRRGTFLKKRAEWDYKRIKSFPPDHEVHKA